jgi:hypothetical protein
MRHLVGSQSLVRLYLDMGKYLPELQYRGSKT